MANVPIEDIEIEIFANWLKAKSYTFSNIMNETGLPPKIAMLIGKKRKRLGLSPGVPDFIIILKGNALLFVEMKRQQPIGKKGQKLQSPSKTSEEQLKWIDALNKVTNIEACICFGSGEAMRKVEEIENILSQRKNEKL